MAITKRYEAPLQVVATTRLRDRIRKIAKREHISNAHVIRDILEAGIDAREAHSKATPGVVYRG